MGNKVIGTQNTKHEDKINYDVAQEGDLVYSNLLCI